MIENAAAPTGALKSNWYQPYGSNELRGYAAGQYIDRDMIATQLEYRLESHRRFGIVTFGGIGEVAPSVSQFRYDNLLPPAAVVCDSA